MYLGIEFDKKFPEADELAFDGWALGDSFDDLVTIKFPNEVTHILDLTDQRTDMIALFGSEEDLPPDAPTDVVWYDAEAGLRSVLALKNYLEQNPEALVHTQEVLEELNQLETLLQAANQQGIRFHMAFS